MVKFAEMRSAVIWTFIAFVCFVSGLVLPYLEGRANSWWSIPPIIPVDLLPLVLLAVSCLVLLSVWIRSVLSKRHVVATGWMALSSVVFFGASFTVRPADLFQRGFCHYAKTVLTADEWRGISRFAQAHPTADGRLPGPGKNLWKETEHRALWSELAAATQIQKLDPSLMILVHPDETQIVWGGALEGHRSVTIFTQKRAPFSGATFIADDIAICLGAD